MELSVQNLIDCDYYDFGCDIGTISGAFDFIRYQGGINDEASYPYEGDEGDCRFKDDKVIIRDDSWSVLQKGDENLLKEAVAKTGPVSAAIDSTDPAFRLYKSGVYKNDKCKTGADDLDHGVLIVGYGTDKQAGDFWIVVSTCFSTSNPSNTYHKQ